MKSPANDSFFMSLGLLFCRLSLGGFIVTQVVHVFRSAGQSRMPHEAFFQDYYKPLDPGYLPSQASMYVGYSMSYLLLLLGVLLIVGLFTRLASSVLCLLGLITLFAMAREDLAVVAAKEPYVLHAGVVLASLAFLIATTGAGRFSFDAASGSGGGKKSGGSESKDKDKSKKD